MLSLVVSLIVLAPELPAECQAPATRDVSSLTAFAQASGSLSVGLDSVATWCFGSDGTWTGGQPPPAKGKTLKPGAAPTGDCSKAIVSCETAKASIVAEQRQVLFDALGDLERPFLGVRYKPKRSGLAERPAEIAECGARDRSTLFSHAQARMDLARLASQVQSEYANYKTWLFSEGLKCAQAVARGEKDFLQKRVAIDTPVQGGGTQHVPTGNGTTASGSGSGTSGTTGTGMSGTGTSGSGTSGTGASGTGASGTGASGTGASGTGASGTGASGTGTSGAGASGTGASGAGTSGTGTSGTGASGTGASGTGTSVTGTSGTGTSGTGTSGTGTSGAGTSGTGTSGTGTSGAGTSGTAASGTGASGTGASGTGASGTGASGTGTSGTAASGTGMSGTGTSGTGTSGSGGAGTRTSSAGTGTSVTGTTGTGALSVGGPTTEREKALAGSMLEKWRYFFSEQAKVEQDADWVAGFIASRELRDCRCLPRPIPGDIVRRLENKDRVAQLEADDEKNTRCEVCLLDAFPRWKTRAQKQCALALELTEFELGVLQRSDDGNGLPPRCVDAALAKQRGGKAVSTTTGKPPASSGAYIITRAPEVDAGSTGDFVKPTDYAPTPSREEGRVYVRIFTSSACVAEVLPGPVQARTGDLLPVPPSASEITVRGPCGGFAEVYFGKEEKPRVSESFARNQPLRLKFRNP